MAEAVVPADRKTTDRGICAGSIFAVWPAPADHITYWVMIKMKLQRFRTRRFLQTRDYLQFWILLQNFSIFLNCTKYNIWAIWYLIKIKRKKYNIINYYKLIIYFLSFYLLTHTVWERSSVDKNTAELIEFSSMIYSRFNK